MHRPDELDLRPWCSAAGPLLQALREDPWLDICPQRAAEHGLGAPGRLVLVAWDGAEQPCGLAVLDEGGGEIELTLAVDPEHRRRGVARALLARARAIADERGLELWARVEDENAPARAFFSSAGARETEDTAPTGARSARFVC